MDAGGDHNGCHVVGDLLVDVRRRHVTVGSRPVRLTAKEFDLLAVLAEHPGWVLSKEQLFRRVWASDYLEDTRVIPVHLANLRRKLGDDPTRSHYLHTIHGVGYKLEYLPEPLTAGQVAATRPSGMATDRLPRDGGGFLRLPDVFIGRHRETATLSQALDDVLSGSARTVLVSGEPGIGKTRLAEEFETFARARGAAVVWGRLTEDDVTPAFWPFVQALRQLLTSSAPGSPTEMPSSVDALMGQLLPEVRDRLPDQRSPAVFDPDEARFRLFNAVAEVVRTFAASRPLVLIIDDLHWAAVPSLRLLEFLVRELYASPVMLLLTYRDTEVDRAHPLRHTLGALARERGCRRVYLEGLDAAEVRSYLEEVTPGLPSARLVAELHERSEGNPFFMREIIRTLISEDGFPRPGSNSPAPVSLPVEVREAIIRRLDHLSPEGTQTLFVAALLGREFQLPLLRRVMDIDQEALLDTVEEAIQAHLVEETPVPGVLRFNHELTREALYSELPAAERMRLHRRVGEAIERVHGGDPDEHGAALAYHFFRAGTAGPPNRAIAYCTAAAQQALDRFAYEDSAQYYDQALQLLEMDEGAGDEQRCRLLLGSGEALMRAGSARGRRAFEDAATIAERLNDPSLLARAVLQYDGRIVGPAGIDFERARLLERAVEAQNGEDSALTVRLLALLAKSLAELGNSIAPPGDPYSSERRRRLTSEAVAMARRLQDQEALTYALTATHMAVHRPDNLDKRLAEVQEIISLSATSGNRLAALCAHFFWHNDLIEAGELDEAARVLEAYRSLAREFRLEYHIGYAEGIVASRLAAEGRFREAALLWEREAIPRFVEAEQPRFAAIARWSSLFTGFLLCGGDTAVGSELEAGLRHLATGDPIGWAWRTRLTHLLAHLGRTSEARRLFEHLAAHDFRDIPPVEGWLPFLAHLSEAAALLGDRKRAELLVGMLAPYEDRVVTTMHIIEGLVTYRLAILTSLLERYQESERYFDRTIARATALGLAPQVAQAQAGWAEMRLRRNALADKTRAAVLAEDCLRLCHDLGMHTLAEWASRLKAQATSPRSVGAGSARRGGGA